VTKPLRAVIVDDEPLSRRAMRQLLDAHGDVDVIAECGDATSAAPHLEGADVVFLDVLMPGRSGLDLARQRPHAGPPFVVFVTAYDEYAVPAFETEAVDFLSKPVAAERLAKTIARVRERLSATNPLSATADAIPPESVDQLLTRVGDREVVIPIGEVECIEADGVYAAVTVGERRYLVRSSLDALERALPSAAFVRVHRSWIVPRDRIAVVRRSASSAHREIVLRSGVVVPVSRRRQAQVMRVLRGAPARGE
jgi:two-component system, LytTR family, response regulator